MTEARAEIPDGCLVSHDVHAVAYIDDDGDQAWIAACEGDVPLSSTIGLLELVKWQLIAAACEE